MRRTHSATEETEAVMTVNRDWELRDVAHCLAAIHERAAAVYRDMSGAPASAAAVRLLDSLVRRECRLAREVTALAGRIRVGLRVRGSVMDPAPPPPLPERIDVESVIDSAIRVEIAVEALLRVAATPPMIDAAAVAEMFAIHRRALFDIGSAASRIRRAVE